VATRPAEAARSRWRARPTAAAHRSKPLPALRFTTLDKGLHLRHRGDTGIWIRSPWDGSRWRWRLEKARRLGASSVSMVAGSGAPPAKLRVPAWASVFGDPSGTIDLAQAVAHRRGGELNTTARVSIFLGQNSLYIGLSTPNHR
jgi:hypothetical protein